jgi:hypothetical protein
MKLLALVLLPVVASLVACAKPNDLPALQASAEALAKTYDRHVAELQSRMDHLNQLSKQLGNPADRDAAAAAFGDATSAMRDMVTMIKSAPPQAAQLASAGKREDLERLVQTEDDKLRENEERIAEDLYVDDTWLTDQARDQLTSQASGASSGSAASAPTSP